MNIKTDEKWYEGAYSEIQDGLDILIRGNNPTAGLIAIAGNLVHILIWDKKRRLPRVVYAASISELEKLGETGQEHQQNYCRREITRLKKLAQYYFKGGLRNVA